jgi:hypothetical protein
VSDHIKTLCVFGRDDGELSIAVDAVTCVHHFAIDFASQGGFGQAGANGRGNLCHTDGTCKFAQ